MAKIPNWSRDKRRESSERQRNLSGFTYKPYVWRHDKKDQMVVVQESSPGWIVKYPGSTTAREFKTKEDAREWSVKWMKRHK